MVDPGDDFDDLLDDDHHGPLLPPDDRIWRHPSELTSLTPPSPEETLLARRRWMQATPSRSGARAAGLVGAILATGVVLAGTHVTSWLTSHTGPSTPTSATLESAAGPTVTMLPIGTAPGMVSMLAKTARSLVTVRAFSTRGAATGDGVVVSKRGYLITPAALIAGASSISVVRPDGEELTATVTGSDASSGIAVLHIDEQGLDAAKFGGAAKSGSFLLGVWRTATLAYRLGQLSSAPQPASLEAGPALLEEYPASLGLARAPSGTVVVGGDSKVAGIVVSHRDGVAIAAAGWLARRVAAELIADGRVVHGWLGIRGVATAAPVASEAPKIAGSAVRHMVRPRRSVPGVRVTSLVSRGAAAKIGIKPGDVIERLDGHRVTSMGALQAQLYLMSPSAPVTLEVRRGDATARMRTHLRPAA